MLTRIAPLLGSAALVGSTGLAGFTFAQDARWAAMAIASVATIAVVWTWWAERRRAGEAAASVDRLGIAMALAVTVLVVLLIEP